MNTSRSDSSPAKWFEVTITKATVAAVLICVAVIGSKIASDRFQDRYVTSSLPFNKVATNETSQQHFDQPVQDLLDFLKVATMAASGQRDLETITTEGEFNSQDQLLWEETNPCTSREELKLRYQKKLKSVENEDIPQLQALMDEYTRLHRTCIRASGDLTTLFLAKSPESGCKFLVAEAGNGLGNRIMWMVSNLMYAILTQRVLLVDPRSMIPSLMCEPFLGSSWVAPKDFPFADLRPDLWQTTDEVIANMGSFKIHEENNGTESAILANGVRADDSWGPISRFYCPTEQAIYSKVRWITLGGCLYFLPKLFAIPTFQPILESLFKDRNPLTHLLRYSMLPVDLIWAKVRRVEEVYLKHQVKMVGVHIRYRGGYSDYKDHHDIVNDNVKDCLVETRISPKVGNSSHWKLFKSNSKPSPTIVVLFISSLYDSLYDYFKSIYPQEETMSTGSPRDISLVHLSSQGEQMSGFEADSQALVEILCLSFSDVLLTSPMSTFSQVAHAYGGLEPWIISFQERSRHLQEHLPACHRGRSTDGCYQDAGVFYVCPYDPDLDHLQVTKHVTSLEPCEDGSAAGVQFVRD